MTNDKDPGLSASHENYLETILQLELASGAPVRSVDVASSLNVSRAGVSKAVHLLQDGGLVCMHDDSRIGLTEEGRRIAREILDRHLMLRRFLTDILGVPEDVADDEACRMEHAISEDTKKRWIRYMKNIS